MKKNLDLNYTGFLSQDAFSEDAEFIPIVTDEGEDDLKNLNIIVQKIKFNMKF